MSVTENLLVMAARLQLNPPDTLANGINIEMFQRA